LGRADHPDHFQHSVEAYVDRLTFGGTIIETGTDSYRLAQSKQLRG
jgi:hypothetical protein